MMKTIWIVLSVLILLATACKHEPAKVEVKSVQLILDSLKFENIGDTVINDMVVKNSDPSDAWMESCVKNIKRSEFIESVFADIYEQKLVAYDYFSGRELTVNDVREIEKSENYSRDIIGKFQFRESWHYDKINHVFTKKVHSIIFGYETYEETGLVKGYKPLFMVKF